MPEHDDHDALRQRGLGGTRIRGIVARGRPEWFRGNRRETLHIELGSDAHRFVRCYATDVLASEADPRGGCVVRLKRNARLEYVVAYRAVSDDFADLLDGAIVEHGSSASIDSRIARSPKPCRSL